MKQAVMIVLAGSVLGGCLTPAVDMTKYEDECIRHRYSRNLFWPNWDRVAVLDPDCGKSKEVHTVTAREAFGQGAGKAFAGGAPIGIGLGLMRFNQTWTNNNIGIKDPVISTLNDNVKYVPIAK